MNRPKILAVVVALGLLVSACGDDESSEGTSQTGSKSTTTSTDGGADDVCTEDRVGGSLTMSPLAISQSLDPFGVGGGSAQTALEYVAMYDTLLRFDEASGEFEGQLAESIEPNDDASEWTLTLREGAEFGNGDPFDAEAVKAATDRYLTEEGSRMRSVAQFVKSVDVVDPLTVKYVLNQPWGFFPIHLSAGGGTVGALGMIPNVKLIQERGVDAFGQDNSGGGAGPYEVKEWTPPERVVLEAKDDWWGGPVCIEELSFTPLPSGQARFDSLQTGEIDMGIFYRDPVVANEAKGEYPHETSLYQSGQMLEFNLARTELADIRVRQAMAAAIDPGIVNDRAFGGEGLPWSGLVHPESDLLEGTDGPAYDPEEAKALVKELKGEGMKLSFELLAGNPAANQEAALAVEALLEAAGFQIDVRIVGTSEVIAAVYSDRNFDLALGGQVGSEATLFASLARFNSQNPANPYGFAEPEFDAALNDLQAARGADELQAAIETVQKAWNEYLPAHVIFTDEANWVYREGIKGLKFTRGVTPIFNTAYIED